MDFFSEIWATLTKNKSRSLLTAFGVFWGMLMLVVMVGFGQAVKNGIFSQVSGFAPNAMFVQTARTSQPYKGFQRDRRWQITLSDLPVLKQNVPDIDLLAPIVFGGRSDNNTSYQEKQGSYQVLGVLPSMADCMENDLQFGRFINEVDIQEKRKVCVIGADVYKVLFSGIGNPVGATIRANGMWYQVVGVKYPALSQVSIGGMPDESIQVPLTSLQQAYKMGEEVHFLMLTAKQGVSVSQIEPQVAATLRQIHQIAPNDTKALFTQNVEKEFEGLHYLTLGLDVLIWIIGLGTLLSGAVGVSNIMLVTVRERTREIGIRRALGASPRWIVRQIMAESALLTTLAGVLGIVGGVSILQLIAPILAHSDTFIKAPQISLGVAIGAFVIIVVIGLLAGLLPARRALLIQPIEALNEE